MDYVAQNDKKIMWTIRKKVEECGYSLLLRYYTSIYLE
jgi:hypothetical protein